MEHGTLALIRRRENRANPITEPGAGTSLPFSRLQTHIHLMCLLRLSFIGADVCSFSNLLLARAECLPNVLWAGPRHYSTVRCARACIIYVLQLGFLLFLVSYGGNMFKSKHRLAHSWAHSGAYQTKEAEMIGASEQREWGNR
ncbi:hypothetical protein BD410DRAFT_535933 [Rickenella mellea]|uniref:Uncharacterized protein n=1 Tax=Rickenella mellea TaxID=50990 RepID=A0A4Y7PTN6_9AGAM|nr:hypothetical protein BD410DRAFT_535933 [Rickenella mellea]